MAHPLLGAAVRAQVERAASAHLGRPWTAQGFTSLDDRASHPWIDNDRRLRPGTSG